MSGLFPAQARRGLSILALALAGCFLAGCGSEGYPTELTYGLRGDLLVGKAPSEQPVYPDSPGHLDDAIGQIKEKGGKTYNPAMLSAGLRGEMDAALSDTFGSPANPKVEVKSEDEEADANLKKAVRDLHLDASTLGAGSVLYRRHCLHCHGVTGNGRGPTGPWVHPHPRDYRQGIFKFVSSDVSTPRKPRREDLLRTLHSGIEGTSMPSFALIGDQELEQLISYVIHLSVRGQAEFSVMLRLLSSASKEDEVVTSSQILQDDDTNPQASVGREIQNQARKALTDWVRSNKVLAPKPSAAPETDGAREESIARGYKLFTNTEGAASCIGCHLDFGRQVPYRYDDWGTLVRPANLTQGVYRGGRRPIDLFWRIKGGVPPAGMPAATSLTDEEAWDVVQFLQALPYPSMLPDSDKHRIRSRIYDTSGATPVVGQEHASR